MSKTKKDNENERSFGSSVGKGAIIGTSVGGGLGVLAGGAMGNRLANTGYLQGKK